MIALRIVPFEPKHLEMLKPPKNRAWPALQNVVYGMRLKAAGPAFTAFAGDEIIGCVGIGILWPGVAEAWMFPGERFAEFAIPGTRMIRHGLKMFSKKHNLHRIQTTARPCDPSALEWILGKLKNGHRVGGLGFKEEGLMKAYDVDGSDHIRVAWVRR